MIVNVTEIKKRIYSFSAAWHQMTHGPVPVHGPVFRDQCSNELFVYYNLLLNQYRSI